MKAIEVSKLLVHATPGAEIGSCIQEAITLAATEWRNVLLVHNGKEYRVYPNDLLQVVLEQSSAKLPKIPGVCDKPEPPKIQVLREDQTKAKVEPLTEGKISKGGQNPPNLGAARPPAPQGSGGHVPAKPEPPGVVRYKEGQTEPL